MSFDDCSRIRRAAGRRAALLAAARSALGSPANARAAPPQGYAVLSLRQVALRSRGSSSALFIVNLTPAPASELLKIARLTRQIQKWAAFSGASRRFGWLLTTPRDCEPQPPGRGGGGGGGGAAQP